MAGKTGKMFSLSSFLLSLGSLHFPIFFFKKATIPVMKFHHLCGVVHWEWGGKNNSLHYEFDICVMEK